jgi:hypothetical protein
VTLTFSLNSDAASLAAVSEGDLAEADAQKILDSSLTVSAKQADDPKDSTATISVNVAGRENAVEMRVVDQALYLRADVKGLLEDFGQDPAQADQLATQAEASGLSFVKPAIEGGWIGIKGLDQLAQQFGGGAASPPAIPNQEELVNDISDAITSTSEVTSEGEDDAGAHVKVAVPIRTLYEKLLPTLQESFAAVPGATFPPATDIPDETIDIDFWIADGHVSQIEFDFTQLSKFEEAQFPSGVDTFAFRIGIAEFDGSVDVPDDVTEVDPQQILQTFMGVSGVGTTGGTGSGAPAGFDCSQLQGAPPEVQAQFADQCPEFAN